MLIIDSPLGIWNTREEVLAWWAELRTLRVVYPKHGQQIDAEIAAVARELGSIQARE